MRSYVEMFFMTLLRQDNLQIPLIKSYN